MFRYVFFVDAKLRINQWDKNLEEIVGVCAHDVLGKEYYRIIPGIVDGACDAVEEVVRSGLPRVIREYSWRGFCGSSFASIEINPQRDECGFIVGAEVRIETSPSCLLSHKIELTQPLIDIGKMSASLAHGIRNPLNAIKGAVTYINGKYKSDATLVEFTSIIEEEIDRLDDFITRFLSGSFEDEGVGNVNLIELLEKVSALISFQVSNRKISFVRNFAEVPPVRVDSYKLENAILNVINNAFEAMPDGGCLTVATKLVDLEGKPSALVEISDTGMGMDAAAVGDLHYPSQNRSRPVGRGFGLFITREVVQGCGGYLEILSGKGDGTVVRMYIPVLEG